MHLGADVIAKFDSGSDANPSEAAISEYNLEGYNLILEGSMTCQIQGVEEARMGHLGGFAMLNQQLTYILLRC